MVKLFRGKKVRELNSDSHVSLGGVYLIGGLFCMLMIVLIAVQMNVRYSLRETSIGLEEKERLIRLKEEAGKRENRGAKILLVSEEDDATSTKAFKIFSVILDQMKEPYDVIEPADFDIADFDRYETIILAITHYPLLTSNISYLKGWVRDGGNLMIAYPPEGSGSFQTLYELLGIKDSGEVTYVKGVHFNKPFMIGGSLKDYDIIDAYESSLGLSLYDDCDVYMQSDDDYPVPLIWRRNVGSGTVVFDNFGIMEKAYRGIHCAAFSLLSDYCVYPVINGSAFYIDDFPAPVPEGDATYITRDYNISVSDFYSRIWWTDIHELAKEYGIRYTGLVIENYNDQVSGEFKRNTETNRFLYFGNMILKLGGEIGIHGYNHMPLVLENFDYKDQYDSYIQWPSTEDMRNSLDEVFDFTHNLFKDQELKVYVPPSNVLSEEGRNLLADTSISSIASVYLSTDMAYEQEFDISTEDGIINTPRITSGCIIDEYMELAALSELNFHFVNTHFIHPDDVLDEDRGAEIGWERMYGNLKGYMKWLHEGCPDIRNLTGSELAGAVLRYDLLGLDRTDTDNGVELDINGYDDEAWMLLRINDGRKISAVKGGEYKEAAENLYLIECRNESVEIVFE